MWLSPRSFLCDDPRRWALEDQEEEETETARARSRSPDADQLWLPRRVLLNPLIKCVPVWMCMLACE